MAMKLHLNGNEVSASNETKLDAFLQLNNIPEKGIAVAVNQNVIPKNLWSATTLKNEDQILIITATQGG